MSDAVLDQDAAKVKQQARCAAFMAECGFQVIREETDAGHKEVKTLGNLTAVTRMIDRIKNGDFPKTHCNSKLVTEFVKNGTHRTGISFDLFHEWLMTGTIPLGNFIKTRDRMESQIGEKLSFAINNAKMRQRRALSDCDGEYNPDRKYSFTPFETTLKRAMPAKTLSIEAHYAVQASVDASDISKYAATIWAIAGIAESNGVMCDVVRTNRTSGAAADYAGWYASESIRVKTTGEYLSPSLLAAALHPAMYRTAAWIARCFAMASVGLKMNRGVGSAWQPSHVLLSSAGKLELSSRVVTELPEHLEQVIVDKICGNHNAAA